MAEAFGVKHHGRPQQWREGVHPVLLFKDGVRQRVMEVVCSECGAAAHISAPASPLPEEVTRRKFIQRGWAFKGSKPLCPTHNPHNQRRAAAPAEQHREEEVKEAAMSKDTPKVAPIKSLADIAEATAAVMQPAAKRQIFRAIDDHWDEDRGRYAGKMTDKLIALDLNVPQAWVAAIREESFGSDAGNDELEELREMVAALKVHEIESYRDQALQIAANFDNLAKQVREVMKRLERVETAVLPRGR
jgi:hypothetical protein